MGLVGRGTIGEAGAYATAVSEHHVNAPSPLQSPRHREACQTDLDIEELQV